MNEKKTCAHFQNSTVNNLNYYSFKLFPVSDRGLVETTRIIHHNQLLFTKFGKNHRHIQSMTSKWSPLQIIQPLTSK